MAISRLHPHPDPVPSTDREIIEAHRSASGAVDNGDNCHFDLEWNDEQLFPDVVYPDADFLLRRMNEATVESVNPCPGEVILDIGCGRGIDGVQLAKSGAVVIGLEPSPVMISHAKKYIYENGANMSLVRAIGENPPFQDRFADKVVCKGALDHFAEPADVIRNIGLMLKPGGKAIIAVANFDSLGFKLGKAIWLVRKMLGFKPTEARMPWEVPEDHTLRIDYSVLRRLVDGQLRVENIFGVSLLFGLPWWGVFLERLPKSISNSILRALDKVAYYFPRLSDVVIIRCIPK